MERSIDFKIAHNIAAFLASLTSDIERAASECKHPSWQIVYSGFTGAILWSLAALTASDNSFEDESIVKSIHKLKRALEQNVQPLLWTAQKDEPYQIYLNGEVYNCAHIDELLKCMPGQESGMQLSKTQRGTYFIKTWKHRVRVNNSVVEHSVTVTCSVTFREDKLPPLAFLELPGGGSVKIPTLKLSNLVIEAVTNLRIEQASSRKLLQSAPFDNLDLLHQLLKATFGSYRVNKKLHDCFSFPEQYSFSQEIAELDDENFSLSVWFRGEQSKLRKEVEQLRRLNRKNDIVKRQLPILEARLATFEYFATFFIWMPANSHSLSRISRRKLELYKDLPRSPF